MLRIPNKSKIKFRFSCWGPIYTVWVLVEHKYYMSLWSHQITYYLWLSVWANNPQILPRSLTLLHGQLFPEMMLIYLLQFLLIRLSAICCNLCKRYNRERYVWHAIKHLHHKSFIVSYTLHIYDFIKTYFLDRRW